jgi:hypothetical protein
MQTLVAAAELADIVAVPVADVETVVETAAAVVAVTEEAAGRVESPQLFVAARRSVLNRELQRPESIEHEPTVVLLTARFWLDIGQQKMGCWPLWRGETTSGRP